MKKLLVILSASLILLVSGCTDKRGTFKNIKNTLPYERNAAIIKDDFFHYVFSIKKISFFNKSTGKFEEIYNRANSKPEQLTKKFVLQPGIYNITYNKKHYKMPMVEGKGQVQLKAGHKYRVNHGDCSLYYAYKRICRLYTAAIWFEDLTTGEVLSGCKWKHLSDKTTSFINKDRVACESIKKD